MRKSLLVGAALFSSVDANQLRIGRESQHGSGPVVRQVLRNEGDVQYSGKITVGGQEIDVVPDTGSFELVFFSDECSNCGQQKTLFHPKKSNSLKQGELEAEQNYGSGSTESREAYDNVKLDKLVSNGQMFWEVYDANMPLLQEATFQGIFGLGPPSSNAKMAKEDAKKVKEEVEQMSKSGDDVSQYQPIVKQYKDIAEFSETNKLWLKNVQIQHFSVCLQKENGSPGVFIYNDDTDLSMFSKKVQMTGDIYWSVKLQQASLAATKKGANDELQLAQPNSGADIILDTGTSLIAVPQATLDKVVNHLDKYTKLGNGCEDLSKLPDLEFSMGGEHFSLPPEAYMGEMDGDDWPDWAMDAMPHLKPLREKSMQLSASEKPSSSCTPLLMSLGDENMWILGMPFFRKYYTRFGLSDDSMDGKVVHFAEAGQNCEIKPPSDLLLGGSDETRGVPKRISAKKLIPPRHIRNIVQSSSLLRSRRGDTPRRRRHGCSGEDGAIC